MYVDTETIRELCFNCIGDTFAGFTVVDRVFEEKSRWHNAYSVVFTHDDFPDKWFGLYYRQDNGEYGNHEYPDEIVEVTREQAVTYKYYDLAGGIKIPVKD